MINNVEHKKSKKYFLELNVLNFSQLRHLMVSGISIYAGEGFTGFHQWTIEMFHQLEKGGFNANLMVAVHFDGTYQDPWFHMILCSLCRFCLYVRYV